MFAIIRDTDEMAGTRLMIHKFITVKKFLSTLSIYLVCASGPYQVSATEVIMHNDLIKQSEGTKLEIDHIVIENMPKSKFRLTLYPEEIKPLASGNISSFIVSRIFPTHKLKYFVACKKSNKTLTLTLSQVHENKMGGICTLKKFGHWSKRSGLKWTPL